MKESFSLFAFFPPRGPAVSLKRERQPLISILGVFLQPGTAKVQGFFARQAFSLGGLDILVENGSHRFGPTSVLLWGKLNYLIPFGNGKLQRFLVHVVPGLAGFPDPFLVHLLDGFLDILGQGIPFLLVHGNEEAE